MLAERILPQSSGELPSFLALAATAGLCEEFLYRGFVMAALSRAGLPVWGVVLLSSVLFGLAHLYQGRGGLVSTLAIGTVFGMARIAYDGLVPVTPETRAAVNAAAAALREAGFRVEPFRPSTLEPMRKLWVKFFVQCGAMFYADEIRGREPELSPIFNEFLRIAAVAPPMTAAELLSSWAELDLLRAKTLEELKRYPGLLCPVASVPAFRHGERSWTVEGRTVEYLDAQPLRGHLKGDRNFTTAIHQLLTLEIIHRLFLDNPERGGLREHYGSMVAVGTGH